MTARRWRVAAAVAVVVALVVGVAVFLVLRSVPDYRTAFLVDTSAPPPGGAFGPIADAVGSAAQNAADDDALSLRRFGGTCGNRHNTARLVGSGRGNGQKVGRAAHALTASGRSTLESGILAAIGDFSGRYPFRGHRLNRIVVVTSHGTDACTSDQAAVQKRIRAKAAKSGVDLDFRFVGYQVPAGEQEQMTRTAAASGAPRPHFATTRTDLVATLKKFTVPESPDAAPVSVPATAPLPDGRHTGYIRRIDATSGVITVDPFEQFTGPAAQQAAREDGTSWDSADAYRRNKDMKTVQLHVAPGAVIMLNQLVGNVIVPGNVRTPVRVPLTRLESLYAGGRDRIAQSTGYAITMSGGQVTRLDQIFHS
ncbi:hypothetical protein BTM25_14880 [Actinomadura rubteroloni]|uniref:VWA domain-containing protein n=1 Tax=Actinomadura rubteroloni TaxID=1926885 RepID=A0A2P4UPX9_9ACTN|nr:hypothetical protein [Actinomadura rubteroloni]POM27079.1 hypothetical protein BTM25_14880 [Actinomadura rubteroloni]